MTRASAPLEQQCGFTLVELAVALFITAIIAAMGYGAVNQAMTQSGAVEEQQARLLAVQTTMRLLAQDFSQVVPRPVRQPVGDGWQAALQSQGTVQGVTSQALITLTRTGWSNPAGIQRPGLQRVSYLLRDGVLRRLHWVVLDPTLAALPVERELLPRVKAASMRYMDGNRTWIPQWPNPTTTYPPSSIQPQPDGAGRALPLAVEVTLELEDWGKLVRILEITQ